MSDFAFYFKLGWEHIISRDALDHQLFILALACVYTITDMKRVLILVTAFTIGHSLTLALSVLDIIRFSSKWVEFLIPCTIFITALNNIFQIDSKGKKCAYKLLPCVVFWPGTRHGFRQRYPHYAGKGSNYRLGLIRL